MAGRMDGWIDRRMLLALLDDYVYTCFGVWCAFWYTCTYMHTYIHTYLHTYIHIHIHVHVPIHIHTYT